MSNVLADDMKSHLNLTKMVEIAKNDNIVFKTLAEPILEGQVPIQSTWPDLSDIPSFVALGSLVFIIPVVIHLCLRYQKLSAIVATLQHAKPVQALPATLTSFVYTPKPVVVDNSFKFDIALSWEHANFVFLLLNTLLLLVLIIKLVRYCKTHQLLLEVTSKEKCIFIPIMKIPTCPSLTPIHIPCRAYPIIVGSWFSPKLDITWTDSPSSDVSNCPQYTSPRIVPLTLWQRFKLAQILKQKHFINLHANHNGYLHSVTLDKENDNK